MKTGFPIGTAGLRVGLLGGSFDPPHRAHAKLTLEALKRLDLDQVWWLVTPGNPLKSRGPAPLAQRLAAARRLMRHPRVRVTALEAALGTRLTVDSIRALKARYPQVSFLWLMGADNLAQFHLWKGWREIADEVPFGVFARPGARLRARLSPAATILARYRLPPDAAPVLARRDPPAWVMLDMPLDDSSSSAIRAAAGQATGRPSV